MCTTPNLKNHRPIQLIGRHPQSIIAILVSRVDDDNQGKYFTVMAPAFTAINNWFSLKLSQYVTAIPIIIPIIIHQHHQPHHCRHCRQSLLSESSSTHPHHSKSSPYAKKMNMTKNMGQSNALQMFCKNFSSEQNVDQLK